MISATGGRFPRAASLARLGPGSSSRAVLVGDATFRSNQRSVGSIKIVPTKQRFIFDLLENESLFYCIMNRLLSGGDPMISNQASLHLSPYMAIYDIVVPQDNMLGPINQLVDFSFVLEE